MANILIKQGKEIAGSSLVTPSSKADKTDLSSIIQTGTASSQAISAGIYFYLNDVLVRAKVDIANGATFTLNTNYEVVTAGALNEMLTWKPLSSATGTSHINFPSNWNEIEVSAMQITGSSACVGRLTKTQVEDIITASVYNSAYVTIGGGYENSSSYFHLIALITATQMSLTFYASSTDISASTKFDVKYR